MSQVVISTTDNAELEEKWGLDQFKPECEHGYIPTIPQYREALGSFATAIQTVAALITAALLIFFIEHIIFTYKNYHSSYRRHVNWIACFYPFAAFMSLLALVVPRAYNICTAFKLVFFSLGISHFTDLTVTMFGCEKAMLSKLNDATFKLSVGIFQCCPWLPRPKISKVRVRFVKWMLWQMPYTQIVYYFFEIYWTTAESDDNGRIVLSYAYLALDIFNAISFLTAMYALAVLSQLVKDALQAFNYRRKSLTLLILLGFLKVPTLCITIVGNYDILPCRSPYFNSTVYAHTVVSLMHLAIVTLFGCLEYWQYHTLEFLTPTSDKHHTHAHELIIHGKASVCIISEMNTTSKEMRRGSAILRRGSANLAPIILENKMALDPKIDVMEEDMEDNLEVINEFVKDSTSEPEETNSTKMENTYI